MFKQIFLDMDGVFVDFDEGVRKMWCAPWWHPTEWKIPYKKFNTTFKDFWRQLNNSFFWEHLPWTEDGKLIQAIMEPFKPMILTACVQPYASTGKMLWFKREWPEILSEKRLLIASGHEAKAAVAGPNKILIDDKEENIIEWEEAGGEGILYPRPWNSMTDVPFPREYLMSRLMALMGGK